MRKVLKQYHIVRLLQHTNGKWFWRIEYNNGNILAHSETYGTKAKARRAARNLAAKIVAGVYREN